MNLPIIGSNNPFAKFFRFSRLTDPEHTTETKQQVNNSQGYSQEQIDFGYQSYMNYGVGGDDNNYGQSSISIQFEQYFRVKSQRIFKYREMSYYPVINDSLDMISDEAIVEDSNGDYFSLVIKEEIPEHIEEQIRDYWDYLINDVFCVKDTLWELFRRCLVDGELYLELILNAEGTMIIDFKVLPPYTMTPVFDDNSEISGYIQTPNYMYGSGATGVMGQNDESSDKSSGYNNSTYNDNDGLGGNEEVRFDKDQVVYVNYGETGRNKLDVRGFLDSSIRTYNQLKYLEDAVVVYRIVRAPERRIWNVAVGRMPTGKANEYVKGLVQRYRKNVFYDPSTGAMDSSRNFQAMTEDFWFAKNENGDGTSVDTLAGGQNLGEITDLLYFEKLLHQNMKIPSSRWNSGGDSAADSYTSGKSGEITREEIKFSRFVDRLRKRFGTFIMDAFVTLLRLQDDVNDRYADANLYNIKFTESNLWRQYKELEILEARLGILGAIDTYIYKPEENENAPFSMEFVLRNWFQMSDEDYNKNKELRDKEKEAARLTQQSVGFSDNNQANDQFGAEGGEAGGDLGGGGDMGFGGGAGGGAGAGGDTDLGFGDDTGGADAGGDFGSATGDTGEFDTNA